jgi:hypothetical protein
LGKLLVRGESILQSRYSIAENISMNKYLFPIVIVLVLSFVSCTSRPAIKTKTLDIPENIMSKGTIPAVDLSLFLLQNNTQIAPGNVRMLAQYYIEEAAYEGVNHDIAFAQMCLETGFLKYGGLVKPEWNNFCGLGSIGPEQPGLVFPDSRTGVRAHIQHLKAYATNEPLKKDLVDPRYRYVRAGSSPTVEGLSGTWAADKSYSQKINAILQRLYEFYF